MEFQITYSRLSSLSRLEQLIEKFDCSYGAWSFLQVDSWSTIIMAFLFHHWNNLYKNTPQNWIKDRPLWNPAVTGPPVWKWAKENLSSGCTPISWQSHNYLNLKIQFLIKAFLTAIHFTLVTHYITKLCIYLHITNIWWDSVKDLMN